MTNSVFPTLTESTMMDGRTLRVGQRVTYFSGGAHHPGTIIAIVDTPRVVLFRVEIDHPEKLGGYDAPYALKPEAVPGHGHPNYYRLRDVGVSAGNLEILP